jgi:ribosomal protein L24
LRQLTKGDKVEVIGNGFERGMKGVVTSVIGPRCWVRITQAGPSHSTVEMIGSTRPYRVTDVRII